MRTLTNPDSLPSARVLREILELHDGSYFRFTLATSLQYRSVLAGEPLAPELEASYLRMADESLAVQRAIESRDKVPFETYRQQYLSPDSIRSP